MGHSHAHQHPHQHTHAHRAAALAPDDAGSSERYHLHGVLLPGEEPRDLWICDGVIRTDPVRDATTLAHDGWLMPGLVDAHCHIGLGAKGAVDAETSEQQALQDRDAGTLLIRDAGSPADTRWIDDRDDLPNIIRAGRHIARPKRYIRNYADEVEPEDLIVTVEKQARAGDGWVKLVGDWIDRNTGDLEPLWPTDVARAAIEHAHALGAKVTAHCFGEQSVAELVRAGIDGIEHGTGLDDATIQLMADNHTALTPTMINLENFPDIADSAQERFPTYASHLRQLYARRVQILRNANEAGVPMYAGTDAGGTVPHGQIAAEIELLVGIGGAEFALGAASWRARQWLGRPSISEGAPADLIVYDQDPRMNPGGVAHPQLIVLNGHPVRC